MMNQQPSHIFEFGDYRLDPAERLLVRAGQAIPLQPKLFDLLLALVERPGRLIEKEELMQAVWPDAVVEEANLTNNISILRKTLSQNGTPLIETVPKRGYRFVAPVLERSAEVSDRNDVSVRKESPAAQPPHMENGTSGSRSRHVLIPVFLLLVIAGIGSFRLLNGRSTSPLIRSIAVTPVRSLATDGRDPALELGMANTMINRLSSVRQIVVRPIGVVQKYLNSELDPVSIGKELRVDAVLESNFQRSEDRIRVTARLVRVADGSTVWTGKFDESFRDIFVMQDDLSEQLVRTLALRLTTEEQRRLLRRETGNAEAYQLCLRGRYHVNRRNADDYRKAIDLYQQAIALDPNFATAWAGLAHALQSLAYSSKPRELMPRARDAVERALALDDQQADAYSTLAMIRTFFDWDPLGAEQAHQKAIALDPQQEIVHRLYAITLMRSGRFDEALTQIDQALAIEPTSLVANRDKAQILFLARRYDDAIRQGRQTLDLDPDYSSVNHWLGRAYQSIGDDEKALQAYLNSPLFSRRTPEETASLRAAYRRAGWKGLWTRMIEIQKEIAVTHPDQALIPVNFADFYARIGEKEKAFEYLEKAYEERSAFVYLKVDPLLDGLRGDPRYRDLLRRVNLGD
jgi:DNA-binding winged helix-turn-helix (wHTH) protein/TolB-like protein/Tfp pilus assembly protein PilF